MRGQISWNWRTVPTAGTHLSSVVNYCGSPRRRKVTLFSPSCWLMQPIKPGRFCWCFRFCRSVLMYQVKFDTFRLELISLYIACNSTSNSSGHLAQLKRSMLYLRLNKLTGKLFFCCRISQSGSEFFCARRLIAWWVYWQMYNKCMRWWHRVIGQVFVNTMCLTTLGDRRSVESFVQVFPNQTR